MVAETPFAVLARTGFPNRVIEGEVRSIMTAVIIGSAALLALIFALLVSRRARARSDGRFETVLRQLDEHMGAISESLQYAAERSVEARETGVGELELTLDLGELLERTVEEATSRTGADVVTLRVLGPNDRPLTASSGEPGSGSLLEAALGPPDARPFRALTIDWAYGPALENDADAYRSALVVPIDEGGVATGAIAAFSKVSHAFRSDQARALQGLAEKVAPGITNARRFARAEERAATDELTGVRNRNAYEAELEREVARAGRTGRPLSLLVLDLTREPTALARVPEQDVAIREFAALVTRVTRATDILCRRGPREFAILLPETQATGARTFFSRLRQELAGNTFTHGASTMVSAGLVDWRPNETSSSLDARVLAAVTRVSGEAAEPGTAPTGDANENARERVGDPGRETRARLPRFASRQMFLDRLAHEVGRAHRDAGLLTLLVLYIGDFRSVNEKLGEVGATRVLADVAARLGDGVPGGGLSCRTREDELAVLMPQTTTNRAESILAALQASLHARPPAGTDRLIVSAGVTELTASDDPGSVFGRAEQALWQARQAGEGTVVVATANGDSRR